jgi:hypothetical protein
LVEQFSLFDASLPRKEGRIGLLPAISKLPTGFMVEISRWAVKSAKNQVELYGSASLRAS